jgi:hypothetical protein
MKLRWRFGVLAGIFLAIFCLYPQMKMLYLRGDDWNGHYAYNDIDEVAYASYVRALIDGRPRKNDPYSGRDDSPETPQPESLFSIQFAAPYVIAIPARILGIETPAAMTVAGAIAGFLAALIAFWFIAQFSGNNWYGMAAGLGIFAFGTLAAGEGAISEILFEHGFSYPYFPGFRRYIPAMGFPAFFAFVVSIWKLLGDSGETADRSGPTFGHSQAAYVLLAAASFAFCVYSYFYIWTTAAAFLGCVILVWIVQRPSGWLRDLKVLATISAGCVMALLPYAYLLSQRGETMDHVQLLVYTRMPDLFRFPEYISFAVLLLLIAGMTFKLFDLSDRKVLFTLSLALVSFVVFNQQIITGRSLQPIHYQVFIGNYVAATALFAAVALLWRRQLLAGGTLTQSACTGIFALAVVWGFVECHYTVRVLDEANVARDEALPVARRLEQLAAGDPDRHRQTVLIFDGLVADDMPTVAPQNILWARHQHVFAGLSWQESKQRYYQHQYYSGGDEKTLDYLLKNDFVSQIALFGWGRHTDRLSVDAKPLTYGEIAEEVARYSEYTRTFDRARAASPLIRYVVIRDGDRVNTGNLEKWYELTEVDRLAGYTIYSTTLR